MLRRRRDVLFLLGADEIDMTATGERLRRLSSAPMATPARTAPTSSCRAPPTPRSPAPTSTPKAACRWPTAPSSRRASQGGLGDPARAVGRARQARCRSIRWRSCAPGSMREYPHLAPHRRRSRRRSRPISASSPQLGGELGKAAVHARRSRISISPTRSRAPPPSWPNARRWRRTASSRRRSRSRTMDSILLHLRPAGPDHPAEVGRAARRAADRRRLSSSMPTARSGRPCSCAAAPTWSARWACCSPSPTC